MMSADGDQVATFAGRIFDELPDDFAGEDDGLDTTPCLEVNLAATGVELVGDAGVVQIGQASLRCRAIIERRDVREGQRAGGRHEPRGEFGRVHARLREIDRRQHTTGNRSRARRHCEHGRP
jgi:hypothetical protein